MFQLFDYQLECLESIKVARSNGARTALMVMASGLGKTVTVAFDAKAWLENHGGRLIYLSHQSDGLRQAKDTFESILGSRLRYGFFNGNKKSLHGVDCLFASFPTMENHLGLFKADRFGYVVVDESHHSQARTYKHVINHFDPRFLLGMTATPNRFDRLDIREIYGKEIYNLPLEEALARRLVTPIDYRMLSDEIAMNSVMDTPQGKLSRAYLNRHVFVPKRDEEIARIITRYASDFNDPRIIVFCTTIEHCNRFCEKMPGSLVVHSNIPERERILRVELFRQGIINTVVTVDCFNESIDIPKANVLVFLRSTGSPNVFLQQLGRGIRKSEGKDKVIALDFVANCERINMVYNLWRKIGKEYQKLSPAKKRGCSLLEPMTLNTTQPNFSERIIQVIDLLDRLKPKKISDYPKMAREYSSRNLVPAKKVSANTLRNLWWMCSKCGHLWQTSGHNRCRGTGCPACLNRVVTSKNNLAVTHPKLAREYSPRNEFPATKVLGGTAKKLWWICSRCGHEWKATGNARTSGRKGGTGCPACANRIVTSDNNLAVTHPKLAREYSPRNEFPANEILSSSEKKVWWCCVKQGHEYQTTIKCRAVMGTGCPVCANRIITQSNNLAAVCPELVKEYSGKNSLAADQVFSGSHRRVRWICSKCGYKWISAIRHRAVRKHGCPACLNRVVTSKNNLAVTHPKLAREYSPRNEFPATKVLGGTAKKLWWICSRCGHEWKASGDSRTSKKRSGCPVCRKYIKKDSLG